MDQETRELFAKLAPRYDLTTTLLSAGAAGHWRGAAIRESGARPGQRVLDVACGTGELSLRLSRAVGGQGEVVALDFCDEMLDLAEQKARRAGLSIDFHRAEAESLPFSDDTFDLVTSAFGIRCVEDPMQAMKEMARVVRPGGCVTLLEFGQPSGTVAPICNFYLQRIMPRLGTWVSGSREAYEHLPRTVSEFPCGPAFVRLMDRVAGLRRARYQALTSGTVYIYSALVA